MQQNSFAILLKLFLNDQNDNVKLIIIENHSGLSPQMEYLLYPALSTEN